MRNIFNLLLVTAYLARTSFACQPAAATRNIVKDPQVGQIT